jgi:ABC-type nitrate/sulfonate/bicarbonate transport system substrate-binding protein
MSIGCFCKVLPFFLILMPLAMAQAEIPLIKFGHIAGVTNTQRIIMQENPQMFPDLEKSYKIEWLQFKGSPLAISAAAAGEIELGEASWTSAILAQVKGIPIITVADVTSSIKGKSFSPRWCVLEDSGINTVHDLKGKKISVITYGGDYDGYIRIYLKKYGIDPTKDVKLLDISQPDRIEDRSAGNQYAGAVPLPREALPRGQKGYRRCGNPRKTDNA